MRGKVVLAHAQNLTNHRGEDMRGHFKHGPLITLNYVKLHKSALVLVHTRALSKFLT